MGLEIRVEGSAVIFRVKVTPRASRTQLNGCVDGILKVKVQAPPVEGAANEAVIRFLADRLGLPKSRVEVVRGETSREKTLRIEGYSVERLREHLSS